MDHRGREIRHFSLGIMDDAKGKLLEPPTIDPRENVQFRIKMREILLENAETDPIFPFQVFANYKFDYFEILMIVSAAQYLKMCRRCVNCQDDAAKAFAHYSILALALDGPVTQAEFSSAVEYLRVNRSALPSYLHASADDLLALTADDVVPLENGQPAECLGDAVQQHIEVQPCDIDFDGIFGQMTPLARERGACLEFCDALAMGTPFNESAALLEAATNGYRDFGLVFNWFRQRGDVYQSFTVYMLSLCYLFEKNISANSLDIFGREYRIPGVREHVISIIEKVTAGVIENMAPVKLPENFNMFLGSLLSTAADFAESPDMEWLAAFQFRGSESVTHCCRALALSQAQVRDLDRMTALLAIEVLATSSVSHYAVAIFQWAPDPAVWDMLQEIRLTNEGLLAIAPFFWDLGLLRQIAVAVKEDLDLVMVLYATNASQQCANPHFKAACCMQMINTLLKETNISDVPVFNVNRSQRV